MRGKKAAQAANRRSGEAQDRVAELEAELRQLKIVRRNEVNALNDELLRLRSSLDQEGARRAAALVRAAEDRAAAEMQATNDDYAQRAEQLQALFTEHGYDSHRMEQLARRALALFGRTLHLSQPDGSTTREMRRHEKFRQGKMLAALGQLDANPGITKACGCGRCH